MKNKPLVSLITTFYNSGEYVHSAMDSLLNQTYQNIEFICVNDGSKDNTLKHLKEYQKKDNRIIIVDKKNEGTAHFAKGSGQEKAKGDFIFLLDHDDALSFDAIEKAIKVFNTNSNLDLVSLVTEYTQPDGTLIKSRQLTNIEPSKSKVMVMSGLEAFKYTVPIFNISILGLWKREVFNSVVFRDEPKLLNSDETIYRKLLLNCKEIGCCDGKYIYYQHQDSTAKSFSVKFIDLVKTDCISKELAQENNVYEEIKENAEVHFLKNLIQAGKCFHQFKKDLNTEEQKQKLEIIYKGFKALDKSVVINKATGMIKYLYKFILSDYKAFMLYAKFKN